MKYACEMIEDLLPLYCDGACSAPSKSIVEEHLAECGACKSMVDKLKPNACDDRLQKEAQHIIQNYKRSVNRKVVLAQLCVLAVTLLVCLIVNLATGKTLDWFFIVLASLAVLASLTVTPLLTEHRKRLWTLVSFAASLLVLLLVCCLYTGGDWFFVSAAGVLLGLSVVFLPFVIGQIPLPEAARRHKGLLVMAIETLLLYCLIFFCGVSTQAAGYWRPALLITTVMALFAWGLFAVIRYLNANGLVKAGICVTAFGLFIALVPDCITWILDGVLQIRLFDANLMLWNTDALINANVSLLSLLVGGAVGLALLAAGLLRGRKGAAKTQP